jgi:hypothetical protein
MQQRGVTKSKKVAQWVMIGTFYDMMVCKYKDLQIRARTKTKKTLAESSPRQPELLCPERQH